MKTHEFQLSQRQRYTITTMLKALNHSSYQFLFLKQGQGGGGHEQVDCGKPARVILIELTYLKSNKNKDENPQNALSAHRAMMSSIRFQTLILRTISDA